MTRPAAADTGNRDSRRVVVLTRVNLYLLPILTAILVPFTGWVVVQVMDNNSAHDRLGSKIELSDAAIVSNFDAKLASQPPPEWRDRITRLETGAAQQALTSARLELMVSDIRTRLFSETKPTPNQ